nr:glutamate receptor 3-like [Procambarus clarkii]
MNVLSSCPSKESMKKENRLDKPFNFIKILLQQDFSEATMWWWERVLWGVWLLVNLLLSRSYSGNLMSYLAVRYIPKPYPTIREFLDDPSAILVWQQHSSTEQYIRARGYGLTRELAALEEKGRVMRVSVNQISSKNEATLVKRASRVILFFEIILYTLLSQEFSKSGRCEFYILKERFNPSMSGMMVPKDSPLLSAFNDKYQNRVPLIFLKGLGFSDIYFSHFRVLELTESGVSNYLEYSVIPNFTACLSPPTKITISTSLSITNLWGIFVVLYGGLLVSLIVLFLEILINTIPQLLSSSVNGNTVA